MENFRKMLLEAVSADNKKIIEVIKKAARNGKVRGKENGNNFVITVKEPSNSRESLNETMIENALKELGGKIRFGSRVLDGKEVFSDGSITGLYNFKWVGFSFKETSKYKTITITFM